MNKIQELSLLIYTPEELAEFSKMKESDNFEKIHASDVELWNIFISKVLTNLNQDPRLPLGKELALEWNTLFEKVYGTFPTVREIVIKKSKQAQDVGLTEILWGPGAYEWILKAYQAHKIDMPK